MNLSKPAVPVGWSSVIGWLVSAAFYVSAIVGSHSAAEWKTILGTLLLAATHAGRQYQAGKKP